ncbi:MAG: MmgE/PrpD family protein [Croceibacterium sp.]
MSGERDPAPLADAVARHVALTASTAVPPEAAHAARRSLLDAIGVMLAATGLSAAAASYRQHAMGPDGGPCTVLGAIGGAEPQAAAFANGALAHALDFGDTFDPGPAHPHAALVPALMALIEFGCEASYGDLLAALAIGGDLACRLSLAPAHAYEDAGWYPPPLVNLIASAAACARLLHLPPGRIVAAMSFALLSGSFPAALKLDRASPLRGTREAFAAGGAVQAALLAQSGASGFDDPLGGPGGFFEVYAGGCRHEILMDGLGQRYLGAEVSFKPWPACRGTHAYIEAALDLRRQTDPADIVSLTAGVGPIQQMLVSALPPPGEPLSATQAKFSIPFTLALAFLDGEVGLPSFDQRHLADSRYRAFAARVAAAPVPQWGREHAASGKLSVRLSDGSERHHDVDHALGSPRRPMSDTALVAKFADCARYALPACTLVDAVVAAETILCAPLDAPAINCIRFLQRGKSVR